MISTEYRYDRICIIGELKLTEENVLSQLMLSSKCIECLSPAAIFVFFFLLFFFRSHNEIENLSFEFQ